MLKFRRARGGDHSPDDRASAGPLHCAFCQKTQDHVRVLISGPGVAICDECVEVCTDILVAQTPPAQEPADAQRWRDKRAALAGNAGKVCCVCGTASNEDLLPLGSRGALCGACADAIEDALAQGRPAS